MKTLKKVLLARPRGFCAGVARALRTVEKALEIFGPPIYIKHEIVHNKHVVENFSRRGALTVERVEDIPEGSTAIFSAHGSPPEDFRKARERGIRVIDATCPLVTKVHLEVHRYLKNGYDLVYIGHHGHVEGKGVRAEAEEYGYTVPLVSSQEEVEKLHLSRPKKAFLTQTTLSVSETKGIIDALKKRYPEIEHPPLQDICYATTNRQQAVRELAKQCEALFIVGSQNSSNSNRLREVAEREGVRAYLLDDEGDMQEAWLEGVQTAGISAGASAPEYLVQSLAQWFQKRGATVEEFITLEEDMHFADPLEIQKIEEGS